MTQTEIIERRAAGTSRALDRRERVQKQKAENKRVSAELLDRGFRLGYDLYEGYEPELRGSRKFSTAYKWDFATGEALVYFSVRSAKDSFSRPAARAALLEHIENETNVLRFRCSNSSHETLSRGIWKALIERMSSHSWEFPTKLVKDYIR